jgi:4-azaleucine resistance transporter AzlC
MKINRPAGAAGDGSTFPERGSLLRAAVGMGLYAGAFGASYGALSVGSGLSVAQTMTLSLVMFSGASQLAFVGVAGAGGSSLAAISTALLLGARNAFYGVPLTEILRPRGLQRLYTAHFVIDETTAMAVGQATPRAKRFAFWATGLILFCLWQLGSLAGAVLGSGINPKTFGLDAAAPAVFLALLWPSLRSRTARWVAVGGGAVALLLLPWVPAGLPVIAAAAVAVVAGFGRERSEPPPVGGPDRASSRVIDR